MNASTTDLLEFLKASPVNFLAAAEIERRLIKGGYTRLDPKERWDIKPGGKYYMMKNSSAVFAFDLSAGEPTAGYKIISAHSDSPGFRIKPHAEMACENGVVKLNTEVYGGPILYTWFDRPLSLAGRVMLKSGNVLYPETRLVDFKRPLLLIPHLAIHFNRGVNDGNPLSRQKDMLPVIAIVKEKLESGNMLLNLIAGELGVDKSEILDFDLSLYDVTPGCTVGVHDEFVSAGRLDDLSMAHAALTALMQSESDRGMNRVMAIFDNEETGSGTKQGAASPVLVNALRRINEALGGGEEEFQMSMARSFMVSADNGHALHPNYPEKQDPTNHPALGGGPVIKINANCKYMTDADSAAVFAAVCERAGVPVQYFVNHSDVAGGSTLGNILTSQIDLRGVDMGAAIWGMHSVRETASVDDVEYIIRAFTTFYSPV